MPMKNMRKPSRNSIDRYILPNKIMCSILGMWPFDEGLSTCQIVFARFRLVFSVVAVCTIFVPQIMLVAVNWGDLNILTGVGCVITSCAQLLFKICYLVAKRERAHRLYKDLRDLWDSSDDPAERQSYEMFAEWARTGTIIFNLSCALTVTVFVLSAIFDYITDRSIDNSTDNNRHLPFDVWYGMDISGSPDFEIAFACQVVALFICGSAAAGMVTTCGTIILHISGQFRLISTWIGNIGLEISCQPSNRHQTLSADLLRCIRHHQRLIQVMDDVNNLLTPIIFMQLLTGSVEICLSGFALLNNDANADQFKFVAYLASMMMQLLLWCGPGEILIQESQEIGYSVYLDVPWYKLPPIYQRYLLLMTLRSQKCCSISALTFRRVAIHTLTTVFNTAVSYFALLRQMQEKLSPEK